MGNANDDFYKFLGVDCPLIFRTKMKPFKKFDMAKKNYRIIHEETPNMYRSLDNK